MSHSGRLGGSMLLALLVITSLGGCSSAESRKERYLEKAEALVAQKNYEKAELEVRNALQIDPSYLPARLLMGEVAIRLGDPRRALQMYQAALDLDESNLEARAGLAKVYLLGGLPEKALELVEPGLASAPDDAALLTVRGGARARLGDLKGATADVERALAKAPSDEDAVALLASLYVLEGRRNDAQGLLENALKERSDSADLRLILADIYLRADRPEDAEKMLRSVIELRPGQLSHRAALVRLLVAQERFADAEQVLREAVAALPDNLEAKAALVNLIASRKSFETAESELRAFVGAAPEDLDLQLLFGDFYADRGKNEQAAEVYREIVRMDKTGPKGLAARTRLAAAAVGENRIDDANRLIAEVLEANPQDASALIQRANIALSKGDTAAAVSDLRAVLRDQPTSVPVQRALAGAYLQSNNAALAEDTLKTAIKANPGDPQLRVDLAQVLMRSGRPDRALTSLQDTVDTNPENLAAQEQLFLLQVARQDFKAARAVADAVKAARPDQPLGDYLTGVVNRAEGNDDAAVASFEAALKLQPSAGQALTALMEVLVSQGRADDAIARLQRVATDQPQNPLPRNLLAEILTSRKRYPEAVSAFDDAIAIAPAWWIPYRGKALAQIGAGDTAAAVKTLQRGLDASGGAITLAVDLGALQERLGKPEEAIQTYESMLKRSPTNDLIASNLAMLLATYRDDPESLERARQLTERFKDSGVAAHLNTAGWVSYKLGRYQEAVPLLQRASDQLPDAPLIRYHLAMAQYKAGQVDDARRNLEAALESGARFPGADDARQTLQRLKSS